MLTYVIDSCGQWGGVVQNESPGVGPKSSVL